METNKFSQALTTQHNSHQRMQRMIHTELPLWKQIQIYKHKWGGGLPTEKLIICETVFCGLATRSVNIIIECLLQRIASVTERLSTEISATQEHLKSGTFDINLEQQDII
jgi:hypothetical protein